MKSAASYADHIIAISQYSVAELVEYYKIQQLNIFKKIDYEWFYNKTTPKYKQAGFMNLILENVPLIFGDRVIEKGFRKAFKGDWGSEKHTKRPGLLQDLSRLSSFDALFIRQSTEVNNEAYAFARKAQQEGIAIIDYPEAILKCCNKVYMAEALQNANINTPKTIIVHKDNRQTVINLIGLPCVLKAPDSTFSFGVKKAKTEDEYNALVSQMLKESDLIIAQEFCPSSYDWRIGIIDDKPFFACKYYMAKDHWQIYNWNASKKDDQDGNADCLPIEKVPKKVLSMALKSAKLMGKGLYGIDIKVIDNVPMVIEINDNPNIDFGVEDRYYGDAVYIEVLNAFKKRLESHEN